MHVRGRVVLPFLHPALQGEVERLLVHRVLVLDVVLVLFDVVELVWRVLPFVADVGSEVGRLRAARGGLAIISFNTGVCCGC